ncbi:MAG: glycosyltransferase family 4 protein [Acidimicrobiales bacterium]
MRVAIDVTSLLHARAGIGTYVSEVLPRLAARPEVDVTAFAVTWRGRNRVASIVPAGVDVNRGFMAARPLHVVWRHVDWPVLEWWTGRVDVVLGSNFVVPPTRRAARVALVHDLTAWRFPELVDAPTRRFPSLVARAVERGAHVLTVSETVAAELTAIARVPADRVHWVHNGLTVPAGGQAAEGRRRAGGARYVLAVGTIEPRKDYPTLVRAFDAVAATDPDIRLVIAGVDGWGTEPFDAALVAARHGDRIVRLGYVDDAAKADLMAGAVVFAYPSRYEGFGMPPLEAMAAGIPVVTTRAGALPEVVGAAAELVAPGDVDALAGAIALVLDDSDRRADLVRRGHERAARYSWDATADGVVEVLRHVALARE